MCMSLEWFLYVRCLEECLACWKHDMVLAIFSIIISMFVSASLPLITPSTHRALTICWQTPCLMPNICHLITPITKIRKQLKGIRTQTAPGSRSQA